MEPLNDGVSGKGSRPGRPSGSGGFRKLAGGWLQDDGSLPTRKLLRRARQKWYAGGGTAFYEMVRRVRPKKTKLETRFEGFVGEFSQHDFGEFNARYVDGSRQKIHFFASRSLAIPGRFILSSVSGDGRAESDCRDAGTLDLRALRMVQWRPVARRLRPPEDDGAEVEEGRDDHRIQSDLRPHDV